MSVPFEPTALEAELAAGEPAEVLIPGAIDGLRAAAETLRDHADALEETGDRLCRLEVTHWRGQAAEGFRDVMSVQPGRWRQASDSFTAAAEAIEGFVPCLGPARAKAREALVLYGRYLAALAAARAVSTAPVARAAVATNAYAAPASRGPGTTPDQRPAIGARAVEMAAIAAGGAIVGPGLGSPTVLVHQADDLRRAAVALLHQARCDVDAAGSTAAAALVRASEAAPAARRFNEDTIRPAAFTEPGHALLDGAGMIPVLGDPADALNAGWYATETRWGDASLSAAGLIPGFGEVVVGSRLARRAARTGRYLTMTAEDVAVAYAWPSRWAKLPKEGLRIHEIDGSHTIARHVGKSDTQLRNRLRSQPWIGGASSYASRYDAERFTDQVLAARSPEILAWLGQAAARSSSFSMDLMTPTGRGIRDGESMVHDMTAVKVVLVLDSRFPNGYRVLSSFPTGPVPKG